jgi:hypothetical protein
MNHLREKWVAYGDRYRVYNTGRVLERISFKNTYVYAACKYYVKEGRYLYIFASENGKIKRRPVHMLVANAFCKKPTDRVVEVNHKDGNKFNNEYDNLEWITHLENMQHAFRTGLCDNSKHKGNKKLTAEQVDEVWRLFFANEGIAKIASRFNIGKTAINNIINSKSWVPHKEKPQTPSIFEFLNR